jgi:very-short-patch-repair endonuclease
LRVVPSDVDVYELLDQLGPDELPLIQRMISQSQAIEITRYWLAHPDGPDMEAAVTTVLEVADRLDKQIQDAVFGAGRSYACEWERLWFRSRTERKIAQALDRTNVLFAANACVRLGVTQDHRQTREVDFLVVSNGKMGVLEVDGPSHEGRAADDHERDRRFREHGIKVVERYTAEQCHRFPDDVVTTFLELLDRNG